MNAGKIYIEKSDIINAHIFTAIISIFLSSFTGNITFNFIYMFLGITTIFWHKKIDGYFIALSITISLFILSSMLFSIETRFGYICYFLSSITLGYTISKNELSKKLSIFYFISLSVFFIYKYLTVTDLNTQVFHGGSRNGISILMIWAFALLLISRVKNSFLVFFSFFAFFISAYSGSRSGLISSSLLLLIPLILGNKRHKLFYFSLMLLLFLYFIKDLNITDVVLTRLNNQGLTDPGRELVIQCYYEKFNLMRAILGINYDGARVCGTLAVGQYALHNSYLDLQSLTGIGSIFVLYIIVRTLYYYFKMDLSVFIVVMLCVLLRAATDDVLFFNKWDYILWAFVFISISSYNSKNKSMPQ